MSIILDVKNLTRKFNGLTAVDGISFEIEEGVCFGLLGPNGAGKTTTIEVIENIISPTSGEILYKGKKRGSTFRNEIGIQFQETALFSLLTVRETLDTFLKLYNKTYDIQELVEFCRLGDILDKQNDKISGGQKQRLMLAMALVNRPELLFLDEPSTGLDPHARHNLWEIVESIKKNGKTIILTTHYMEEAEHLCDDIAIMDNGRIAARGTPKELIQEYTDGVTIELPRSCVAQEKVAAMGFDCRGELDDPENLESDIYEIITKDINADLARLMENGVNLGSLSIRSPNLEDVFLNLTGRKLRE